MLHSVLGVLVATGWAVFAVAGSIAFMRNWRQLGMRSALRAIFSRQFVLPFLLVLGLSVLKASLIFVYPHHVGVVVSLGADEGIRSKPIKSGLHFVVPLAEQAVMYPIYWQTYTMSDRPREGQHRLGSDAVRARTSDNQEVMMDVSVIFRIDPDQVVDVHRYWQDRYAEDFLRPSIRGFLRNQVSQFTVGEVNSERRNDVEHLLDEDLKRTAGENGLIVNRVLLRNIGFTKQYAHSVEKKQVAMEGEIQKLHEAKQIENLAEGEATRIRTIAQAKAAAVIIEAGARAQARVVRAEAEAKALNLVAAALKDKQNLLTYRYINRLSPNVQAVVLPHDMPLIFPLPNMQPPMQTVPPPAEEVLPPAAPPERRVGSPLAKVNDAKRR